MVTLNTSEISITFLAIFLLLISSFICGKLFELIKAPKVVGEIVGGMLLGASCLELFCPDMFSAIFKGYSEEEKVLDIFYQLGLIFLMFSSGYNTSINVTKKNAKIYSMLLFGATVIPILLGLPFINLYKEHFIGEAGNTFAFAIVFLIAMSITSIPVISKIFFDIGMMNTKFSNMVLTVSTIQDLCLWIALNMSISVVTTGGFKASTFIVTTILTIGLLMAAKGIEVILNKKKIKITKNVLSISILVLLLTIYLLSQLNINIMYSAFIGGYIMKSLVGQGNKDIEKIKDFAFAFFIPLYFSLVGIRLDVVHNFSLVRFIIFFIIAFLAEFIGTTGVMWFSKLKKKTAISLGITMNARGGPGIVLATTAYAHNIISLEFFTVLIITTMLSSAIAGYWLRIFKEDISNEG